ncbi:MAG: hypothetical protein AAF840_05855 [Bacteroidota bacterium]
MNKSPRIERVLQEARQLNVELSLAEAKQLINGFPPSPPPRQWTDLLPFKTKWIMFFSTLFSLLGVLVFSATPELPPAASPSIGSVRAVAPLPRTEVLPLVRNTAIIPSIPDITVPHQPRARSVALLPTSHSVPPVRSLRPFEVPSVRPTMPARRTNASRITNESPAPIARKGSVRPHDWAACAEGNTPQRVNLEAFRKLVVKSHVRLIIRQGTTYRAEVFTSPGHTHRVDLKVSKDVLTVGVKGSKKFLFSCDIQLTVPKLEEIVISPRASVYHYGNELFPTLRVTKGDFCRLQNFDHWQE